MPGTDFRSMYDSNYLYAFDLQGRDVHVTIKEVKAAKVKNADKKEQRKPIVFFRESKDPRGLVLCKTNGKTIAALYGNAIEGWIGKRITLFPTMVDAFGQTVEAIRIRPIAPKSTARPGEFADTEDAPTPESPEAAELEEQA
jgi:hypothetical protein